MESKFRSRKFLIATYFSFIDTIALFVQVDIALFGVFIGAQATILGMYSMANVKEK